MSSYVDVYNKADRDELCCSSWPMERLDFVGYNDGFDVGRILDS